MLVEEFMKRRDVKYHHEKSVIDSFQAYLASNGAILTVVNRPDPPDAIVDINGARSWVEITDAFTSDAVARSITSAPADDVPHWTCGTTGVLNPDESFEEILTKVINNKLSNQQLQSITSNSGKGILLVGIYSVFHDSSDFPSLLEVARNALPSNSMFSGFYLYSREHEFHKV
jgi:hypothetical protein